jgi:hypothetical protein
MLGLALGTIELKAQHAVGNSGSAIERDDDIVNTVDAVKVNRFVVIVNHVHVVCKILAIANVMHGDLIAIEFGSRQHGLFRCPIAEVRWRESFVDRNTTRD